MQQNFNMTIHTKIILFILLFASISAYGQPRERPETWATPIINAEIENFYKVSDKLYRSEQPDKAAFQQFQSMGIYSVLNLRKHHSDRNEARKTKIKLHHLRLSARNLTQEQIFQALKIIQQSDSPVLIHCWHGSDRTGSVAAAYRMVFQNWSATEAIDEFKNGGYGYHEWAFPNLVVLLENLDVNGLRAKLGIIKKVVKVKNTKS
jgi:protein tyrosine phosphatase (PTP) superfamily phosphohydrolase (DUF442 family)